MKIGRPFNQLQEEEYRTCIENHKQYDDFNTLGLYRSLLENELLTMEEKLKIRDFAHIFFQKTFDFLQLKDPYTYFKVSTLGEDLTRGDELNHWRIIRQNQQQILKQKKIKHRNFGAYSKHDCGYEHCPYNGLMVKQGSPLAESSMHFKTDKNHPSKKAKAERQAREQRNIKLNPPSY